jgi:hypothetical protein
MTASLSLHNIYVEGDDDISILSRWFPRLQFKRAGGKDEVKSKVEQDDESSGELPLSTSFRAGRPVSIKSVRPVDRSWQESRAGGAAKTGPALDGLIEARTSFGTQLYHTKVPHKTIIPLKAYNYNISISPGETHLGIAAKAW